MAKPPTSVRSIRLPEVTWIDLAALSERLGVSVNALVVGAVAAMLDDVPMGEDVPRLTPAELEHVSEMMKPGRLVRVLPDSAVKNVPLRMPRAPIGSLAKKPKGK